MILKKISEAGFFLQSVLILIVFLLLVFTPLPDPGFKNSVFPDVSLYRFLSGLNITGALWIKILGAGFLLFLGFLYNNLVVRHELVPKQSIFLLVIFSGFMLLSDSSSSLMVVVSVTMLLLNTLLNIFRMHSEHQPYAKVLNATISLSIASLIVPQAVVFILFVWLGFFTLRIGSWREWVISLIGLMVPYFYYAVYLFLTDGLLDALEGYQLFFRNFRINYPAIGIAEYVVLAFPVLILILSIGGFISDSGERVIAIRKKMWLNVHFFWVTVLVMILSGQGAGFWLPLMFLPLSLFMTHRIVSRRKSWIFDFLFFAFIALVLFLRIGI
ncbi:MAG: hypothetical protein CVT94_14010 [Bacteroidetes bacterium HGW-Bacteroidetes-11]|jgi:hypothetical protein|nr:MAG: hypothetical protein CVT94_14010 [Bacteroidetes bacterium HGW-Bacteroidetes-11]